MAESQKKPTKTKQPNRTTGDKPKPAAKSKELDLTGVPEEVQMELLEIEAECASLARKSAAEVFHLGRRFAKAKENLPNKYEEWVRKRLVGITTRTASNYISVHERFEDQKEKVIQLGLKPSALYEMAGAPEAAITEIFDLIEAGETLLGVDVSRVLKKHKDPAEARMRVDKGGPKGLKEFVADCNATSQKRWFQVAEELLAFLTKVYPEDSDRLQVKKPELVAGLAGRANWLAMELSRMSGCGFYHAADEKIGHSFMAIREWTNETWKRLSHALLHVTRSEGVPLGNLKQKIRNEVVPGLRWALGRETEGDSFLVRKEVSKAAEVASDDEADETRPSIASGGEAAMATPEAEEGLEAAELGETAEDIGVTLAETAKDAPGSAKPSVAGLGRPRKTTGPTASEMSADVANDEKPRSAEAS